MNQEPLVDAFVNGQRQPGNAFCRHRQPGETNSSYPRNSPVTKITGSGQALATVRRGLWNQWRLSREAANGRKHPTGCLHDWDEDAYSTRDSTSTASDQSRCASAPTMETRYSKLFQTQCHSNRNLKDQVARSGWSDGFDVALKPDGYIKVTRNGNTHVHGDKNAGGADNCPESDSPRLDA